MAAQVEAAFFTSAHRDQLLLDMEKRLEAPDDPLAGPMLSRYHDLLVAGGKRESPPRSADDPVLDALSVVGLVRRTATEEEVRNPIFARAFDLEWVERRLHRRRVFGPEMARWQREGRPTHLLLVEKQLEDALRWRDGRRDVAWEENDFIDRSLAHSLASRRRKLATWTLALGASIALAWGVAVTYTARLTTILQREANASREVAAARAAQEAADSRLAEWKRIQNVAEACDNAFQSLHRREAELVDAGALVDALGSRLAASNAQSRALDASLEECRVELTDAGARIATLGGELTGCNGRLADAGARITALGGELTGATINSPTPAPASTRSTTRSARARAPTRRPPRRRCGHKRSSSTPRRPPAANSWKTPGPRCDSARRGARRPRRRHRRRPLLPTPGDATLASRFAPGARPASISPRTMKHLLALATLALACKSIPGGAAAPRPYPRPRAERARPDRPRPPPPPRTPAPAPSSRSPRRRARPSSRRATRRRPPATGWAWSARAARAARAGGVSTRAPDA